MTHTVLLGGSGFVGDALANELAGRGGKVTILCRNPASRRTARAGADVRIADPTSIDGLAAELSGADVLVNLVGILNEKGFDGSGFRRAHVDVTANALAACRAAGVERYVQMSALRSGEGSSHYLKTKGEADALVAASDLDWAIFRPSVIFGPADSFLNRFAGLVAVTPLLMPLACASSRFQPIYVGDVADAFANLIDRRECGKQTLDLGGPTTYTLKQLVQYVVALKGKRTAVLGLPGFLSLVQAYVMNLVPGKPFSTDNYRSLQLDSVTDNNALAQLGVDPTPLEAIAPTYIGNQQRVHRFDDARSRAGRD
ncbi:MAG: complex I NDUFA9 subunit family protein [Lysobacterales bacterium]